MGANSATDAFSDMIRRAVRMELEEHLEAMQGRPGRLLTTKERLREGLEERLRYRREQRALSRPPPDGRHEHDRGRPQRAGGDGDQRPLDALEFDRYHIVTEKRLNANAVKMEALLGTLRDEADQELKKVHGKAN